MMMASNKKKMIPPVLPEEFRRVENTDQILKEFQYREERVAETVLQEITAEEEDYSHLVFSAVKFVNCRFWNCSFERCEFTDVIFKSCDFSGCNLSNTYFNLSLIHI